MAVQVLGRDYRPNDSSRPGLADHSNTTAPLSSTTNTKMDTIMAMMIMEMGTTKATGANTKT